MPWREGWPAAGQFVEDEAPGSQLSASQSLPGAGYLQLSEQLSTIIVKNLENKLKKRLTYFCSWGVLIKVNHGGYYEISSFTTIVRVYITIFYTFPPGANESGRV